MLVGTGAQQWAKQHGFHTSDPDELITGKVLVYMYYGQEKHYIHEHTHCAAALNVKYRQSKGRVSRSQIKTWWNNRTGKKKKKNQPQEAGGEYP